MTAETEHRMSDSAGGKDITLLLETRFGRMDGAVPWSRTDLLHRHGSPGAALLYAVLFAPEFIEIEGSVFLDGLGPEAPRGWGEVARRLREDWTSAPDDFRRFINSFNWVEVPYLFAAEGSDAEYVALAAVLTDAWHTRLLARFPQRRFNVRVLPASETGSVIGLGFEELRTG